MNTTGAEEGAEAEGRRTSVVEAQPRVSQSERSAVPRPSMYDTPKTPRSRSAMADFSYRYIDMYNEVIDRINTLLINPAATSDLNSSVKSTMSEDYPPVILHRLTSPDPYGNRRGEKPVEEKRGSKSCWWCCTSGVGAAEEESSKRLSRHSITITIRQIAVRSLAMVLTLKHFTARAIFGYNESSVGGSFTSNESITGSSVMRGVSPQWTDEDVANLMDIVSSYGIGKGKHERV